MGDAATNVADQAVSEGTFVLASAAENKQALAPPGETYTAFTGELIELFQNGVPGGPELLDLNVIYKRVDEKPCVRNRDRRPRSATGIPRATWHWFATEPGRTHRLRNQLRLRGSSAYSQETPLACSATVMS